MRTNKKTLFVRIMAIVLSVLMLGSVFATVIPFLVSAADADALSYPLEGYNPGTAAYEPIPLLIIMVNFDADGDGVDDNPDGSGYSAVRDKENAAYGEQWCHTTEEDWTSRLFSYEGNTLNTYYKYMSNDKFWWIAPEETYGTANNGVIAVTIKNVHPNCIAGTGQWVHCYKQIIEAASEYVDFSKYDANGNGRIDKYEFCFAFIIGGAETSSGSTTMKEVFGFHAYYKDYDPNNVVNTDGVEIGHSGFFGTGAISGNNPLNFGVFAHELGHYLGAPDLYDTDGQKYDNAVGWASMMASGSHGTTPAHFDPYMLSEYGFYSYTSVLKDGEYTLYSKASKEGDYNILKLSTPNPGEYFLIENRNSSIKDGSTFDGSISHGILIWHIDENIHKKTGNTCNSADHGLDPAVVVYAPLRSDTSAGNALETYNAFVNDHPTYKNYAVFKASSYKFPISKTWYTSMTAEQAKEVENLKVTVTSAKGDEMTVKIEGVYDPQLEPEWTLRDSNVTKTSMTVTGTLSTLNYCTLTGAECELIDASTNKSVRTDNITLDQNYQFKIDYTDLNPNTNYIVKISSKIIKANETAETVGTVQNDFYTLSDVVKTKATVTVNIGGDLRDSTTAKPKVGETVEISSALLTKKGYKLEGWYLDEALTQPFDITKPIESTDDFTIWAKWIEDTKAATLTVVGADASTFATEVGGKFTAPVPEEKAGYTFGGWYADADCTVPFDFEKAVESTGEVKIYAKWVGENGDVVTPNTTTTSPVVPDNTTEPDDNLTEEPGVNNGLPTPVIVAIVAVAVVVAGGAVAAGVVLSKKKK
ncbi:MAG: M6 family metalloprotease domain-containing protein [Clostridia bacterium]|nr:M6 family metalloprotease domain-containing protein [Clostridia bacterium]